MRVKELIEKLKALDEDLLVVLSRDAEGNGFEELDKVDAPCWLDEDDVFAEEDWDEDWSWGRRCVVLWP